jgi:hypothetical protein
MGRGNHFVKNFQPPASTKKPPGKQKFKKFEVQVASDIHGLSALRHPLSYVIRSSHSSPKTQKPNIKHITLFVSSQQLSSVFLSSSFYHSNICSDQFHV